MNATLVNGQEKPLGGKAFNRIPHLSFSKLGDGDHFIDAGHERICTKELPKGYTIRLEPKLDGACCAVYNNGKEIIALGRTGYRAETSNWDHLKEFARYIKKKEHTFKNTLSAGSYCVGEWIWQTHNVRYLTDKPYVVFDLFEYEHKPTKFRSRSGYGHVRKGKETWEWKNLAEQIPIVGLITVSNKSIDETNLKRQISLYNKSPAHGELDIIEGAIYRVEREGECHFCVKYVREDFEPGKHMEKDMKPLYCCQPYWR